MNTRGGHQVAEREHFDRLAEGTGETWWGNLTAAGAWRLRRRVSLIVEALARFTDPRVLEVGCGTGALSGHLLERLPSLKLTACDISPRAVEIARKRYQGCQTACFDVADVASLQYARSTFDAVVGNSVLHHVPLEACLTEFLRVLRPEGIIWFSEPNMLNPQIAIEKKVRFVGRLLQNTEDETAFFRWSLAKTLQRIGFEHVQVQPYDFLHPIVPRPLIGMVAGLGQVLERIPLLREISGSLLIYASKPQKGGIAQRRLSDA